MLKEVEDAITARLQVPLEEIGCFLRNTPESNFAAVKAEALVFLSSRSRGTAGAMQRQETASFTCNVYAKDMRTHQVIYPILELIQSLLDGYQPLGIGKGAIEFKSEQYFAVQTKEGLRWHYSQTYDITYLINKPNR